MHSFLETREANAGVTARAVDSLVRHGLLQPWGLPRKGDASAPLEHLYRVNQKALGHLDGDELVQLRDANAVPVACAQILSESRVGVLKSLAARQPRAQLPENVSELFPGMGDGLQFTWEDE